VLNISLALVQVYVHAALKWQGTTAEQVSDIYVLNLKTLAWSLIGVAGTLNATAVTMHRHQHHPRCTSTLIAPSGKST
jgi:hypothetical protein